MNTFAKSFRTETARLWFGTNGDGLARYDGASLTFLSVKDGLAGAAIRGILQSSDGAMWFATDNGVSRYKSGEFTNYTTDDGLKENQVWSIFQDSTGAIWVGTMGGVCRFDGKSFAPFPIPRAKVDNPVEGFGPQVVWSIFEDRDGNMWFGTDGEGARKFDGKKFTIFTNKQGLAGNTVRSIVGDKQGRIWFGTRLGGASCLQDGAFKNFTKADGLANNEVYEILEDNDGNLWFSTRGNGVCHYDGKTFKRFSVESGLTLPHVQSIFEDKTGVLWLGCSGGLFSYDGKSFVNVGKNGPWPVKGDAQSNKGSEGDTEFAAKIQPLLENYCANCHAPGDMEGLEFLSAMTEADVVKHRGLFASVAQQIESRAMPPKNDEQPSEAERKLVVEWLTKTLQLTPGDTDRISQYVVAAYQDRKGDLWFGTMHDGAVRYDGKTLRCFTEKDGLPTNVVTCFAEDKQGNLWVGTHAGVCNFDGEKFTRIGSANGLPDASRSTALNSVSVQADRDGNIWVGAGQKVFCSGGESFTEFKMPIDVKQASSYAIVPGRVALRLQDQAGNLWFGTDGFGAYKFDGKAFTHFTKEDGLCSNNVNSIAEDQQGNIWFACMQSYQPKMTGDGGVCRFDGKSFTKFPNVKGLRKNDIYTIYPTRSGDIWIGATGVGAYRYDGTTFTLFDETDKPHWTRYFGVQDMLEDRNGILWFGFSGGLFRFDGKSFFNVTKDGPWKDLVSAMADAATGILAATERLNPQARAAFAAIANKDFAGAETILQKLKSAAPHEPAIQEKNINQLGYHFVLSRQLDIAVEIFKINTHLYPNVSNTFDSLGEGYWRKGDEKHAVESYNRALELNPKNKTAMDAIRSIEARQKYQHLLVAPSDWLEEVFIVPPSFAPTMSLTGLEHLRLPPDFRDPESDWFISYLFAIELTEPNELNEKLIGEQLLCYFRGLASGGSDKNSKKIETEKFTIEPLEPGDGQSNDEYIYSLKWQEPFAGGTPLEQNLRVKLISGKNQHGIVFICGSPQPFKSVVWGKLLEIRAKFEATLPSQGP